MITSQQRSSSLKSAASPQTLFPCRFISHRSDSHSSVRVFVSSSFFPLS
jgi:hypothetical protein